MSSVASLPMRCTTRRWRPDEAGDTFDHGAALGFIKIYGLPAELAARKAPSAQKPSLVAK